MSGPIVRWLHRHDPEWNALHKAIKVAVAVTVGLAIGTLIIGNSQFSTFASFGGVALLLFAEFPGGRSARLGAFVGLALIGALLIVLGTLASVVAWLAVAGMAVVGFIVLFAGLFSAAAAGATRAALLAFILPVSLPGTAADIPARLGGWALAVVLAVPLAILVWPPRDHDRLRFRAAAACAAMSDQLLARSGTLADPGPSGDPGGRARSLQLIDEHSEAAILALRQQFRSTIYRPVGLTTGSRMLMQLPDRLSWLRSVIDRIPRGDTDGWPEPTKQLVVACADVLGAGAEVLAAGSHRPTVAARQRLTVAMQDLDRHRAAVRAFLAVIGGPPAHEQDPDLLLPALAHELAYTTHLAGQTVSLSAAADARPLIDRLIGRGAPETVDGPLAAVQRITAGHITRRSVWFQNSLRGALGLSAAVLIAELTQVQHGFWIVLAAMSVLRTTALTTGSTALRALGGTFVGFLVGAGLIYLFGTTSWHLWLLLPVTVVVAAYLPEAVSFTAGQAAFTVMVVILFNIIEPVGWTVGLVRIEDIALGCAAGLISGVLLWPRGAAAQIRQALGELYLQSASALERSVQRLASSGEPESRLDDVIGRARGASYRLDDALREYLAERGTKSVPVESLAAVCNGGNRVRLAAEAISGLCRTEEPITSTASPVRAAGVELVGTASAAARWLQQTAEILEHPTPKADPAPAAIPVQAEHLVLETFRAAPVAVDDPEFAERAKDLWQAALYVDDVTRLEGRLGLAVAVLNRPGTPGRPMGGTGSAS